MKRLVDSMCELFPNMESEIHKAMGMNYEAAKFRIESSNGENKDDDKE